MTSQGVQQLIGDEGCVLTAYPDPLSGADPWTVGVGSTGPGIGSGTVWTREQATDAMNATLAQNEAALNAQIPWWTPLFNTPRGDVLENMAYNLGVSGLMKFTTTLADVKAGHYVAASQAMLQSTWATQVPNRATQLSAQMASGVYAS